MAVALFFIGVLIGYLTRATDQETPQAQGTLSPNRADWNKEKKQLTARIHELQSLLEIASVDSMDRGLAMEERAPSPGVLHDPEDVDQTTMETMEKEEQPPTMEVPPDNTFLQGIARDFNEAARRYHLAIREESVDPAWAYLAAEEIINAYISNNPPPGTAVESVECRSSVCRLRVTGESGVDWQTFGPYLWKILKETVHSSYSLSYIDDSKTFATAYYERRAPTPP